MTALLIPPSGSGTDTARRRPLTLLATGGGVIAALSTLIVCLGVGVVGWFAADAGAHGAPRDGLRVGALAWLVGHGSGVHVRGVWIGLVPLGLLLLSAWATGRIAARVGASISGHGPDADRIADGERDWTVPVATALFAAGYLLVALTTGVVASTQATSPSLGRLTLGALAVALLAGGPAIAVGSGRAPLWLSRAPLGLRVTARLAAAMVLTYLATSALVLTGALIAGFDEAATVLSRLHTDPGESATLTLVGLLLLPNAVLFAGAYLLGPGFAVGSDTLVSPSLVQVGELPLFPLLGALPESAHTSQVVWLLLALPLLIATAITMLLQRRHPTSRWDAGALRGCAGGITAGLVIGVITAAAGGAAGPGRMADVAADAGGVLVHAVALLGLGGLLGGLIATGWQRRTATEATD